MASNVKPGEATASSHFISTVPDAAKVRMEIDELVQDNDLTNLFLLALSAMQQEEMERPEGHPQDWWSYYSLSGDISQSNIIDAFANSL